MDDDDDDTVYIPESGHEPSEDEIDGSARDPLPEDASEDEDDDNDDLNENKNEIAVVSYVGKYSAGAGVGAGHKRSKEVADGAVKSGGSDADHESGNMGSRGVVLVSPASCKGVVSFQDLRRPFLVAEFPSSPRSTQKLIISSFPHAPFQITFTHTNSPSIPHTSRMFGVLC